MSIFVFAMSSAYPHPAGANTAGGNPRRLLRVKPPMMSSKTALAGLLVALNAAAAGCGNQAAPVHPPAHADSPWSPPAGTTAAPQPLRFALVSADGRRVTVNASGGGCTADLHLATAETRDIVTLTLTEYVRSGPCAAYGLVTQRAVTLRDPLGPRDLVDGTSRRPIRYFDGRKLAAVRWLPSGASAPQDRPNGAGWIRVYNFAAHAAEAPLWIEQAPGDILGEDQFHPGVGTVTMATVHGHPARMITQYDDQGVLLQDRLGWFEAGYTYVVSSMPSLGSQRPLPPDTLERIAKALRPSRR